MVWNKSSEPGQVSSKSRSAVGVTCCKLVVTVGCRLGEAGSCTGAHAKTILSSLTAKSWKLSGVTTPVATLGGEDVDTAVSVRVCSRSWRSRES